MILYFHIHPTPSMEPKQVIMERHWMCQRIQLLCIYNKIKILYYIQFSKEQDERHHKVERRKIYQ